MGIAGAILTLGLWARDLINDPVGAQDTLQYRFLMAAGVLIYVTTLTLRVHRNLALLAGYAAILVIEFALLLIWGRLAGSYSVGFPGYLYIYLLTPLMVLPFAPREVLPVLVLIGLMPNLQAMLGMAPRFPLLAFNVLVWPASVIVAFSLIEFDRLFRRLFLAQRHLREQALRDPLTGLGNRRYFDERANSAMALTGRHKRPLTALMVDIDHFKRINDELGHAAGDDVLCALGNALKASLRGGDFCGRLGGEEFAVVLPDIDRAGGAVTAERLRQDLERLHVNSAATRGPINFTVSIGVAAYPEDGDELEALLQCADRRLYRAKEGGRNRVITDG